MRKLLLALALPTLLLLGCDAPPDTIAGRIITKVEQACQFRADQAWLEDVVVKAGVTVQMVDELVGQICAAVAASKSGTQSLIGTPCPHGEIEIGGVKTCVEGEPVNEPEKEGE